MENKTETSVEFVKHVFTKEEKARIASDMAQKVSHVQQLEDDLKSVKSDFKAQIDSAQATVSSAAKKLTTGYEMRSMDCEVVKDYKKRMVYFYLPGHEKISPPIKEREMHSNEYQMELPSEAQ